MSKEHKITLVVEGDCPGVRRESAEKKPGVHGGQTTGCLMDVSWMCIAQILRITWEDTISTISLNMFLTWDGSPKKGATVILMLRGCKKLISVTGLFERPSHTHTHTHGWIMNYALFCVEKALWILMNALFVCVCVCWLVFVLQEGELKRTYVLMHSETTSLLLHCYSGYTSKPSYESSRESSETVQRI